MIINNIEDIYSSYNIFSGLNIVSFFVIILLFLLYMILNYILSYTKKIEKEEIKQIKNQNKKINYLLIELNKLEKQTKKLNKSDFYNKLNLLFRNYFVILGLKESEKMSLKELSETNFIKKDIFDIYKQGYYYEFNKIKDNYLLRKEIIRKFIYILKQN